MAGYTNKGKFRTLGIEFRGVSPPTDHYLALVTDAVAPAPDINTKSELTELPNGNGYTTGGIQVERNSTDWDVLTEDDANDRALVQMKDQTWTASGGSLPASGDGARYAILTDDNGTDGSREVLRYWDLTAPRSVSVGQTLTLQNLEVRLNES